MKTCPQCHLMLEHGDWDGLPIWVCRTCGGCWLDADNFRTLIAAKRDKLAELNALYPGSSSSGMFEGLSKTCPDCRIRPLSLTPIPTLLDHSVQSCGYCGGVWLEVRDRTALSTGTSSLKEELSATMEDTATKPALETHVAESPVLSTQTPADTPSSAKLTDAATSSAQASIPPFEAEPTSIPTTQPIPTLNPIPDPEPIPAPTIIPSPEAIPDVAANSATDAASATATNAYPVGPIASFEPAPSTLAQEPTTPQSTVRSPVSRKATRKPAQSGEQSNYDIGSVMSELASAGDTHCCPRCLVIQGRNLAKCPQCGVPLVEPDYEVECPACGVMNNFANTHCDECHVELRTLDRLNNLYPVVDNPDWVHLLTVPNDANPVIVTEEHYEPLHIPTHLEAAMWCPQCRRGYPETISVCFDCGVALVYPSYRIRCLDCFAENTIAAQRCWNCQNDLHSLRAPQENLPNYMAPPPPVPMRQGSSCALSAVVAMIFASMLLFALKLIN